YPSSGPRRAARGASGSYNPAAARSAGSVNGHAPSTAKATRPGSHATPLLLPQRGYTFAMNSDSKVILMPLDVSSRVGFFDRTAGTVARITSRAPFFAFCLLLVMVWLLQGIVEIIGSGWSSFTSSTYQLEINTTTTIINFLLVTLLNYSQPWYYNATQHKRNAIADVLAYLMARTAERYDSDELRHDIRELRAAVGLEEHESSSDKQSQSPRATRTG